MMISQTASPLSFHRSRRDHQLRMFFSSAQRTQGGKPIWVRVHGSGRKELLSILADALFHAREVARDRPLEWPEPKADESDLALQAFLEEIQNWFRLLETVAPGGDDPRAGIAPMLEGRIRHGLRLFHTGRQRTFASARSSG